MDEVKTGVDELMELVRREGKLSLPDIAKRLKVSERVIQNWVDFLVEEKLLGVEYKFTTPIIYLNKPAQKPVPQAATHETFESMRALFLQRAKEKNMPHERIPELWHNHLAASIDGRREFFREECRKRALPDPDGLFARYKEKLLAEEALR